MRELGTKAAYRAKTANRNILQSGEAVCGKRLSTCRRLKALLLNADLLPLGRFARLSGLEFDVSGLPDSTIAL